MWLQTPTSRPFARIARQSASVTSAFAGAPSPRAAGLRNAAEAHAVIGGAGRAAQRSGDARSAPGALDEDRAGGSFPERRALRRPSAATRSQGPRKCHCERRAKSGQQGERGRCESCGLERAHLASRCGDDLVRERTGAPAPTYAAILGAARALVGRAACAATGAARPPAAAARRDLPAAAARPGRTRRRARRRTTRARRPTASRTRASAAAARCLRMMIIYSRLVAERGGLRFDAGTSRSAL